MKIIIAIALAALLSCGIASVANAQDCVTSFPPDNVNFEIGDTWCIQFCKRIPGPPVIGTFLLQGLQTDEAALPVITFGRGCAPGTTTCMEDCIAIDPPTGGWILGGHPSGWYDDMYWMGNSCVDIRTYPSHEPSDNFWTVIIDGWCSGCFCFTFEGQLPVELLDFTAVAGDEEVQLNWRTASETNTDHFEIARGGEKFTEIDAENAPSGAVYSWTDNSVVNGNVYAYSLYSVSESGVRELLGEVNAAPSFTAGTVTEYALYQNYPNPFNPETKITFDLVESGFVSLKVVNLLGQEVAVIANGEMSAGRHVVSFNGSNLTSGVYLYTMTAGDFSAAKKLVLLK